MSLVQCGSDLYLMTEDVVKVYRTEPLKIAGIIDTPDYVYIVTRTYLFNEPSDIYRTSDWPIQRVCAALGLTDVSGLEDAWERS